MQYQLDFGKHKGRMLQEVPLHYVHFLAGFRLWGTQQIKNESCASDWVSTNKSNVRLMAIDFLHGKCWKCGGKLVPVGASRQNGADHDDWEQRILHKQCWKLLKKEEEYW
jgi:hypothetical protein